MLRQEELDKLFGNYEKEIRNIDVFHQDKSFIFCNDNDYNDYDYNDFSSGDD